MHIQNRFKRIELFLKMSDFSHRDEILQDLAIIYVELRKHNLKLFEEDDPDLFPLNYFKQKGV